MSRGKSKTELFGKHPLAKSIEPVIEAWSNNGYPSVNGKEISWVTRELFKWWFSDEAHENEKFHICQRRALETIIYCYEILEIPPVKTLFSIFSPTLLEKENLSVGVETMKHPRFAVKMATGTGKTWVVTALIIWQYWNKVKLNDSRFASHFLLCAPGNIVFDRLLDSFLGKKDQNQKRQIFTSDIKKSLFMPEEWRSDFYLKIYSKDDLQNGASVTEDPFILITNWHQLMDSSRKREPSKAEDIGIDVTDDSISLRVQKFVDFLTLNNDLLVINDEAHHVHNATDSEQKRWQESLESLREIINKSKGLFVQFDFTATPFTIKGKRKEYFPHVIYDYGLVEAMRGMLVKQIFIEKSSLLSSKIEKLPPSEIDVVGHKDESGNPYALSGTQQHMINVGLTKLENLEHEFKRLKINKKPVMFIVADQNLEADLISRYIKQKLSPSWTEADETNEDNEANKQVVTLHEGKKNGLSDEDYAVLKNKVFTSDDLTNPVRIIVSVLMLREGFDVRNVCVLVVLRRSDSDLLTEQVIGRGIRIMFPEPEYSEAKIETMRALSTRTSLPNSYDLLFIVEHPKYNEIYNQLTEAGAIIASGNSIELSLDSKSVLISAVEERIEKYDLSWASILSYRTEEQINFSYFGLSDLPSYNTPFEEITPTKIVITDLHPDTKFRQEWELVEENFSYSILLNKIVREIIGTSKRNIWLSRYASDLAGVIDNYISEYLFGKPIDFQNEENVKRLRNQQLFDFIVQEVRKHVMKFIQNIKSTDSVEAQWTKLSSFKDIKVRMERAIPTTKCIYPFIDFPNKGGLERDFTKDVLENDSFVEAYVKLNQYVHQFSIQYINNTGHLVPYYPDFIVRTKDLMLIVETKGQKDAEGSSDVLSKAKAAEERCREISRIKTLPPIQQPKQWKYILLPQDLYKELEGSGLKTIIDRCESFLALLKMKAV